jgi:hypothetical protein
LTHSPAEPAAQQASFAIPPEISPTTQKPAAREYRSYDVIGEGGRSERGAAAADSLAQIHVLSIFEKLTSSLTSRASILTSSLTSKASRLTDPKDGAPNGSGNGNENPKRRGNGNGNELFKSSGNGNGNGNFCQKVKKVVGIIILP